METYFGKLVALEIPFAHSKDRAHAKRAGFAFEPVSKLWAGRLNAENVALVRLLSETPGVRFLDPAEYAAAYGAARA